jgi:hypothetical protein
MAKGVIDIEFILAVVVFLSAITFVSYVIIGNVPALHRESLSEDLRSRAYQVSQLLLFDQGEPADWDTNPLSVQRLGLSTGEAYTISSAKITALATVCGDYNNLKSLLSQDFTKDVKISVVDAAGTSLLDCGPAVNTTIIPEFPVVRYAVLQDGTTIVRLLVSVI